MIAALIWAGMPPTTTPGGGHGFSDGAWDRFGSKHRCGRRELAGRHQSRGTRQLYHANYSCSCWCMKRRGLGLQCSWLSCIYSLFISVSKCALGESCCVWMEKSISNSALYCNNTVKTGFSSLFFRTIQWFQPLVFPFPLSLIRAEGPY